MPKKEKLKDGIYMNGKAADEVTGSMYLVRFGGKKILLECGLYQSSSNSYLEAYRVNSKKFDFKPKDVDYVFICHAHIDHCGLLPRLVKEGFRGKVIMTSKTKTFVEPLLRNSCYIVQSEAKILSKQFARVYQPVYTMNDVDMLMTLIETYDNYSEIKQLDDVVSFRWYRNAHCIGAAQLQLILKDKKRTKKILYTSDLGNFNTPNHYVDETEIPTDFVDVAIMESTYGNPKRYKKKTREFDVEKLKTAIDTATQRKGTVICPAFSFSRTQELLTCLYELYHDDKEFKPLIYVDSVLSVTITNLYESVLEGDDLKLWNQVRHWSKVRYIKDSEISKTIIANDMPKVVITASGFCTNGRVINYLRKYIKRPESIIIFSGYVGDNPSYLSYRLLNHKKDNIVKINGQKYPCKANTLSLSTYSSHIDYQGLLKFGSSLNTNKLILVHGSEEAKTALAPAMQEEVCKKNKTFQVVPAHQGMIVDL